LRGVGKKNERSGNKRGNGKRAGLFFLQRVEEEGPKGRLNPFWIWILVLPRKMGGGPPGWFGHFSRPVTNGGGERRGNEKKGKSTT